MIDAGENPSTIYTKQQVPTKFILGVLTFLIVDVVEERPPGAGLLPCIAEAAALLTMLMGFR